MSKASDSSTDSEFESTLDETQITKKQDTQPEDNKIIDSKEVIEQLNKKGEITTHAKVHNSQDNSQDDSFVKSESESTQQKENSQKIKSQVRFNFKVTTQLNRYNFICNLFKEASAKTQDYTIHGANSTLSIFTDLCQEFLAAHNRIGDSCPEDFFDHSCMTENYHKKTLKLVNDAKILMNTIIEIKSCPDPTQPSIPGATHQTRRQLPEIELPKFSGDYSSWISFRDLFTALVSNNPDVDGVQKMHYLKTSLEREAAQLISNMPLTGDSFTSAWGLLTSRYENKRLLIASQMDKLFQTSVISAKSASDLNSLLTSTTEALNTLASLDAPVDSWDLVLVHFISRRLDSQTREAWEVKLGSQLTPPTYQHLTTFLTGSARALENMQLNSTQYSQVAKTQAGKSTHGATTSKPTSTQSRPAKVLTASHKDYGFDCACCNGSHFIVICEKFWALSSKARRNLVKDKRLYYNCLGNHSANACQSSKRCRECNGKHHTMIHSTTTGTTQQNQRDTTQPTTKNHQEDKST